jgi:four helix bundle protein
MIKQKPNAEEANQKRRGGASAQAGKKPFDLEERTALFGETILTFVRALPQTPITAPLITQLVKSGTSVGANYCEATETGTKKEFRNFVSICRREAKEGKFWLRMIAKAVPASAETARGLWSEENELHHIFNSIHRKTATPARSGGNE